MQRIRSIVPEHDHYNKQNPSRDIIFFALFYQNDLTNEDLSKNARSASSNICFQTGKIYVWRMNGIPVYFTGLIKLLYIKSKRSSWGPSVVCWIVYLAIFYMNPFKPKKEHNSFWNKSKLETAGNAYSA